MNNITNQLSALELSPEYDDEGNYYAVMVDESGNWSSLLIKDIDGLLDSEDAQAHRLDDGTYVPVDEVLDAADAEEIERHPSEVEVYVLEPPVDE